MVPTKKILPILIAFVMMLDCFLMPVIVFLSENKEYNYSDKTLTYPELFASSNDKFNSADYIEYNSKSYEIKGKLSVLLKDASFKPVSFYEYGFLSLLYKKEDAACSVSLSQSLRELLDIKEKEIENLSKESGFITSGLIFDYKDKHYLLGFFKNENNENEDLTGEEILLNFTDHNSNSFCLYEISNINDSEYLKVKSDSMIKNKTYPTFIRELRKSVLYKIAVPVILLLQYIIIFGLYFLIKKKIQSRESDKSAFKQRK